jgi:hypothetical protein
MFVCEECFNKSNDGEYFIENGPVDVVLNLGGVEMEDGQ